MKQLLASALFAFSFSLFAQQQSSIPDPEMPNVIPPSPTVANLMHFEEVPVDTYSGQPDITLPLASKNLGSGITLPVALRYSTLGLRVHERSGWVGKGWSLEAGGTVSRTVRGGVADEKQHNNVRKEIGIYFIDNFWNFNTLSTDQRNEYAWNVIGTSKLKWDSEPDLYQYSALGMSGRFVVLKQGNALIARQLSLDNKVKIDLDYNPQTYIINTFTITDGNGIKYIFGNGATEITKSIPRSVVYPRQPRNGDHIPVAPSPVTSEDYTEYISAWHLVSVKNTKNEELADFYYTESIETYSTPLTRTENRLIENGTEYNFILANSRNLRYFKPERIISYANIEARTKKLNSIVFRDGSKFNFELSTGNPENNGAYLNRILLKNKLDVTYKTITFQHEKKTAKTFSWQISNGYQRHYDPEGSQRLWLNSVIITATELSREKYLFKYFDNENFLATNCDIVDSWGYENGDFRSLLYNTHGYFYYDYDAVRRGSLSKIIYPTGGIKEFVFEPHTYTYEYGNQPLDNYDENPLNEIQQTYNRQFNVGVHDLTDSDVDDGGNTVVLTHPQEVSVDINININPEYEHLVRLGVIGTSGNSPYSSPYYELDDFNSGTISLPAGSFKFKIVYVSTMNTGFEPGSDYGGSGEQHIGGNIFLRYRTKKPQYSEEYKNYLFGGGLRIKHIDFKDSLNSEEILKKRVMYDYNFFQDATHTYYLGNDIFNPYTSVYRFVGSNGVIDGSHSISKNYTLKDSRHLFPNDDNSTQFAFSLYVKTITYNVTINEPVNFLTKGTYVGYRSVKVSERVNITPNDTEVSDYPLGYTQYDYTSAFDDPIPTAYFNYPYKEVPDYDYKRGLLTKKTVFNNLGQKLQETTNNYDYELIAGEPVFSFFVQELEISTGGDGTCKWIPFYDTWLQYSSKSPDSERMPICEQALGDIPCFTYFDNCINDDGLASYYINRNDLSVGKSVLTSTENTEYFYDGNTVTSTTATTNYEYNLENYQIKSHATVVSEGGELHEYRTEYNYPVGGYDTSLFSPAEQLFVNAMESANIINAPIVVSSFRDGEPMQKVITKYENYNGLLLPAKAETLKGVSQSAESRINYHGYNEIGNLTEVSQSGGSHTYYVWGYNGTLPVAKIDNFATSDITPSLQTLINNVKSVSNNHVYSVLDPSTENNLKSTLDALRSALPGHQVTTLIHDPARGVVLSVKDPRGIEIKYTYDNFGRLVKVEDHQGNLLSENEYHYRID